MWAFIWLGLVLVLVLGLLFLAREERQLDHFANYQDLIKSEKLEYNKTKLSTRNSQEPNDYTVGIVKASKVSQPPFPPCTGFVDEVVYAPTDTNADIAQVKADLATLRKNIPNYVMDGIREQTGPLVKRALREQGCPLTDAMYGAQA